MMNNRGQITVDFIFAIVLVLGFTSMLFIMSFSLTVASITQYVTYSAARNYAVANIDQDTQEQDAKNKYQELISNKVFKPLYANGWYKIDAEPTVGDQTQTISGYASAAAGSNDFWGVGTHFVATILEFKIPFFGSTVPDGDGTGKGFTTYLGSYLGREPTEDECVKFTAQRWDHIKSLPVSSGSGYGGASSAEYFPMTDDGC